MKIPIKIDTCIHNVLRKRYVLALSIIAFLVIFTQFIIQCTLTKQENDSRVINIAGRQRMLSQRISKTSFGLYLTENEKNKKEYLQELISSLNLWEKSHEGLQKGDDELGLPGNNSLLIRQLFSAIDPSYQSILKASKEIITIAEKGNYSNEDIYIKVLQIKNNELVFLKGMDTIVFQYDDEAKQKVNRMKQVEYIIMFVTLCVLILEALYIFRPAEKQIHQALYDLKESQENLDKLFETSPSPMFLLHATDLSIIKSNYIATQIIGMNSNEAIGYKIDTFFKNHHDCTLAFLEKLEKKKDITNEEFVLHFSNNEPRIMLISASRILFHNQWSIILGLSDITKQKKAEEILRHHATTDDMTGLLNRRTGLLILEKEMEKAKRELYNLTICFIDLDGLKSVNDSYGHQEGDWYIRTISNTILHAIRSGDTVFRFGGDEILLILSDSNLENSKKILQRIEKNLIRINQECKKSYTISISYGLAQYKTNGVNTVEEFIHLADQEMYAHKKQKKQVDSLFHNIIV